MVMAKAKKSLNIDSLYVTRITRTLFFFCGLLALSIVVFDSGNLITREAVIDRWLLTSGLFVATSLAWFVAGVRKSGSPRVTIGLLAIVLLITAGYMTYWERGMASTSTIFYVLPLLVVATLKNRHALMAMAALSAGTYALSCVLYFNTFFNEGYRIQLWGSILLYSGTIFVSAWLIMIVAGLRKDSL